MKYQPLTLEHAHLLSEIHKRCFKEGWSAKAFLDLLKLPCYQGWLTYRGNEPAGFLLINILPPDAEIITFAVLPAWRRQSVGKQLLEYFLKKMGASLKRIFLEVEEGNQPAIDLYKKIGFQQIGVRPNYYVYPGGILSNALLMQLMD